MSDKPAASTPSSAPADAAATGSAAQPAQSARERKILKDLSYKAFTYPGDEEALAAVKRIPGVPKLFDWLIDNFLEEYYTLENLYNNTRVSEQHCPAIHQLVHRCCEILDLWTPEVYLTGRSARPVLAFGVQRTFLVLNSSLIDRGKEDELMFLIGCELGSMKAGHVLYMSVAEFIIEFLPVLQSMIPFNVGLITQPMLIGLYEWARRAQFTCDRAGVLCVQDPQLAIDTLARHAGKPQAPDAGFSLDYVLKQGEEVSATRHQLARLALFLKNAKTESPYAVPRIRELKKWIDGGAYAQIMSGKYELNTQDPAPDIVCPGCGKKIRITFTFCPHCGADTQGANGARKCPSCGTEAPDKTRFCAKCGAKLGG